MSMKSMVSLGVIIGSIVGSYVPMLWGAGVFSMSSLFGGAIGSIIGIYIAYRISQS